MKIQVSYMWRWIVIWQLRILGGMLTVLEKAKNTQIFVWYRDVLGIKWETNLVFCLQDIVTIIHIETCENYVRYFVFVFTRNIHHVYLNSLLFEYNSHKCKTKWVFNIFITDVTLYFSDVIFNFQGMVNIPWLRMINCYLQDI